MQLRPMTPADAPAAEALTRHAPEASQWAATDYAQLLVDKLLDEQAGAAAGIGLVAEASLVAGAGSQIIGFLACRVVSDMAEILNLVVDAAARRRGAGRALVAEALRRAAERGARRMYLEVRLSNAPARALYGKLGFHEIARRRDYYCEPLEDAIVLERVL